MRLILVSAAVVLAVMLLTVVLILRRDGRTGDDLLASQMRSFADVRPAGSSNTPAGTSTPASPALPGGVDDATWRRIGELAMAGRRVQAIELLRTTVGCRLTEAKAVVDRLTREGSRSGDDAGRTAPRAAPRRAAPGPARFPPGWDAVPPSAGDPGRLPAPE